MAGGLGAVLVLGPAVSRAEDVGVVKVEKKELLKEEGKPEVKPAPAAPEKKAAVEVKVSPEAQAELAKVTEAYQKLTSLEVAGTMSSDISVGGEVQNQRSNFEGSFVAPNKFRHEMKGDIIVGSTGEKFYAFRPERNDYQGYGCAQGTGGLGQAAQSDAGRVADAGCGVDVRGGGRCGKVFG